MTSPLHTPSPTRSRKRRFDEYFAAQKSLLETGKHSDFIITCGKDTYNVHKSIICPQSDFFDAATRFGKESLEGKIHLPEDRPEVVRLMIDYLYGQDYSLQSEIPKPIFERKIQIKWNGKADVFDSVLGISMGEVKRLINIVILSLPDNESMEALDLLRRPIAGPTWLGNHQAILKNNETSIGLDASCLHDALAIREIFRCANKAWQTSHLDERLNDDVLNHARVYALAEKYNIKGLKLIAAEKFKAITSSEDMWLDTQLHDIAVCVYESTPDTDIVLRDIVARRVYEHLETVGICQSIDEALRDVPDFAYRVLLCRIGVVPDIEKVDKAWCRP